MDKVNFSIISDAHVTYFGAGECEFNNAVRVCSEKFNDDAIIFLGDIIYQLDSPDAIVTKNLSGSPYDFVLHTVDKYIPEKTEKIYILGNHEYPQGNDDEEINNKAMELWVSKIKQPVRQHKIINGYHFLFVPIRAWCMPNSNSDELWIINEIERIKEDNDNKPIFLCSHDCMPNTAPISDEGTSFSQELREYMTKQSRIIHITGHQHNNICDEKSIYQDGFTTISAPVCGVGCCMFGECEYTNPRVLGISQGLHFEVEENIVKVSRIDYTSEQVYEKEWIIDTEATSKGIFKYDKERIDKYLCNAFSDEAFVEARQKGSETEVCIKQSFVNNEIVEYYRIEFINENGKVIHSSCRNTDFYNIIRGLPMKETAIYKFHDIKKGIYKVCVTQLNCFYETDGRQICTEIMII